MAAWEFPALRFVEHIAVDPGIRGGGLGKKLMLNYIGRSDIPILLEVEPPSGELEQRRIGFYERLGFHLNAYEYNQPPLRTGQADLPLRIMTYPRPINREEFHKYRKSCTLRCIKLQHQTAVHTDSSHKQPALSLR